MGLNRKKNGLLIKFMSNLSYTHGIVMLEQIYESELYLYLLKNHNGIYVELIDNTSDCLTRTMIKTNINGQTFMQRGMLSPEWEESDKLLAAETKKICDYMFSDIKIAEKEGFYTDHDLEVSIRNRINGIKE